MDSGRYITDLNGKRDDDSLPLPHLSKAVRGERRLILLIIFVLIISGLIAVIKWKDFFSFPFSGTADGGNAVTIGEISDKPLPEVNIINKTPPVVSDCFEENRGARYELSAAERDVIERVVMAEAGGEGYEGQKLIAKCILNSAEKLNILPSEVVVVLQYTKARPEPSDEVRQAVSAVFDIGERVIDDLIMYFYNPDKCESVWHETQIFVVEHGGHRFFSER